MSQNRRYGEPIHLPDPIEPASIPREDLGEPVLEILNHGDTFHIFTLPKEGFVPESLAVELHRKTYKDLAMQADVYRFGIVSEIMKRFLFDQNGRRANVLGRLIPQDSGEPVYDLAGIAWTHPLVGNDKDVDLVTACDLYSRRPLQIFLEGGVESWLLPKKHLSSEFIGTFAVRVYSQFRNRKLSIPLIEHTLRDHYDTDPDSHGVVARVNDNDANAVAALSREMPGMGSFQHISGQEGVSTLLHERPELSNWQDKVVTSGTVIRI